MSLQQSNLSASGYDVVIATTQDSINAMIQDYMRDAGNKFGKITNCLYANNYSMPFDSMYNPVTTTDEATFKAMCGTDPLTDVKTSWNRNMPYTPAITNLQNSHFIYAFTAQPGVPKYYTTGDNPPVLPQLFEIAPDNQSAIITMLFKSFSYVQGGFDENTQKLVILNPRTMGANEAWSMRFKVPFANNTAVDIPGPVQTQVNNMGSSPFSIQQLLLDFSKAQCIGFTDGIQMGDASDAIARGISLQKIDPVLGYSIVVQPPSNGVNIPPALQDVLEFSNLRDVQVTSLELEANAYVDGSGNYVTTPNSDQAALASLNYVCAVNSHALKPIAPLKWNWLDSIAEENNYHGAIAVSRNIISKYLSTQLVPLMDANCYLPYVKANTVDLIDVDFPDPVLTPGQAPTLTYHPTGSILLDYRYKVNSSDTAGALGCNGTISLDSIFDAQVSYSGNSLTIVQHLQMVLNVSVHGTYSGPVNVVDKTITDVYTISVDDQGNLQFSVPSSTPVDNSSTGSVGNYTNWSWMVNQDTSTFAKAAQTMMSSALKDIQLAALKQFVFPAGEVFSVKDAIFSDYGDLVGHITYAGA